MIINQQTCSPSFLADEIHHIVTLLKREFVKEELSLFLQPGNMLRNLFEINENENDCMEQRPAGFAPCFLKVKCVVGVAESFGDLQVKIHQFVNEILE